MLFSPKGRFVKQLEADFAKTLGVEHAYACTSGTAAIHVAIAAIDPEPGDEIITTSITDMGALTPILYQGAIPVFADVDPLTCNVTAETIEARLSPKTKAIIVTHLFGSPCDMTEIMELADARGIPVIEDAAQAFGAVHRGRKVGTIGAIGCFSLQQGKHITTGEGGLVVSNDPDLARRAFLFINKAWGYGDQKPDHYFLALNYRMSELQGAVAAAQLPKLDGVVDEQSRNGGPAHRDARPACRGSRPRRSPTATGTPTGSTAHGSTQRSCAAARRPSAPRSRSSASPPRRATSRSRPSSARSSASRTPSARAAGRSRSPARRPSTTIRNHFPGTFSGLEGILVLPWNEKYTDEHVEYIGNAVIDAVKKLSE